MSKALAIDFSTSNTGYAFRNPLTNEYVVGSIAGGKSKILWNVQNKLRTV